MIHTLQNTVYYKFLGHCTIIRVDWAISCFHGDHVPYGWG
jgi:hypothetical protein